MLLSKKAKRLGDYVAGTIVIRELSTAKLKGFLAAEETRKENAGKTAEEAVFFNYPGSPGSSSLCLKTTKFSGDYPAGGKH